MIDEVRQQPDVFAKIIQNQGSIVDVARQVSNRNLRCYCAVGCGSSYYAAIISMFSYEHIFNLDSRAVPSSEFIWYPPAPNSQILIALSRSGRTSETLEATRRAKKIGIPSVAVTSDPASPMARESDYCLDIRIGEEQSVVMTKSFTASTLVSMLLGYELGNLQSADRKEFEEELARLPGDASHVIREVEDQAKAVAQIMRGLTRFIYLGSGPNYGSCLEGALKLRETSYTMCEVYHIPEIRHGPFALLQNDVGVITIVPEDRTLNQSEMLLEEMASTGATVIPISNVPKITKAYEHSIEMPAGISANFMPLLSVIAMQMVAFHYAVGHGVNPDLPRNLTRFVSTDLG